MRTEQMHGGKSRGLHWCRRRRYSTTTRTVARSAPTAAIPSHGALGAFPSQGNSFSSMSWVAACSPGLPARRSALGPSATWMTLRMSPDMYSFSSGVLSGPGSVLLLMARSAEHPENGWLSIWEDSPPGLLSSGPEPQLLELLSA